MTLLKLNNNKNNSTNKMPTTDVLAQHVSAGREDKHKKFF